MARLLIVDESVLLCGTFKRLLEEDGSFNFDIAQTYQEAKDYLSKYRYEFAVVSRTLPDAKNGEVIALLNKHNVSPMVYTTEIDEHFVESFESANIVEYILRHRYDNVEYVISRLNILKKNKQKIVLIVHKSEIYRRYLKQNLALHHFKVLIVASAYEAIQKLQVYPEVSLMIINSELVQLKYAENIDGLELVRKVRKMELNKIKIIVLAEKSNSYETSFFLNEGADDYIINPYSRDELYIRIYQNIG